MNEIKVQYYRHARRVPPSMKRQQLAVNDLTILLSGKLSYVVDGVSYERSGGDVIFIPARAYRERMAVAESADYVSFNFDGIRPELPTVMPGGAHSEIVLLLSALDKIAEKPGLSFEPRCGEILSVVISVLEDLCRAEKMSDLTRSILDFLHTNYKRKITLRDVAEATFFTPVYCDTVFSREVGRSILDYVIFLRISEAERLIIEGSMSIGEIAEAVGFSDSNYFSRMFKRRTGYTPSAYRKAVRS